MKVELLLSMAVIMGTMAYAQSEPGVNDPTATEAKIEEVSASAEDLLQQFLDSKGWVCGDNFSKGKYFKITTGVGTIAAPISDPNYNTSRANAFDKAMLVAKAEMAKSLEQTLSSAIATSYVEQSKSEHPTPEQLAAQALAAMPDDSILGKTRRLISAKLDTALTKEGVDLQSEKRDAQEQLAAAQEKMNALLATEDFKKTIAASATCAISGMQAFYTVETKGEGKQGAIGVVAIWSPALAQMASSLVTGKPVAATQSKLPIREQLPSNKETLLATFGVQQKVNENGEYVLVSFGQAGARSSNTRAEQAAYAKAKLNAEVQIRNFAGEMVAVSQVADEAETSMDFGGETLPEYTNESAYQEFQQSVAQKMKVNGIAQIYKWKYTHPISGKPVYGVVCTWSPSLAEAARASKAMIDSSAKAGAQGVRTVSGNTAPAPKKNATVEKAPQGKDANYLNSGASGDDDAF